MVLGVVGVVSGGPKLIVLGVLVFGYDFSAMCLFLRWCVIGLFPFWR